MSTVYKSFFYIIFALFIISCDKRGVQSINNNSGNYSANALVTDNIAFVNIRKIETNSLAIIDFEKKMTSKEKEVRSKLINEKNAIEKKYKSLEEKKATLSQEALNAKAKEIENDFIKLQTEERMQSQFFELTKMRVLQDINTKIQNIAEKIAENNNYKMVFVDSGLIFKDPSMHDITIEILSELNVTMKTVDFNKVFDETVSHIKKEISKKQ